MINFDGLVNNYWHLCAHASELSKPGDFIKYQFFDNEVVIYNDGSGVIAFDNICPHRGAKFYTENFGNSMAVCKYHGWTIANNRLHIPSEDRYADCKAEFNKYKIEFCGSFIFFAIKPTTTLSDQLGGVYDLVESISFDCDKLVDINSYVYQCNALVAVENALEPDHVPFVHSETLFPLNLINCNNQFHNKNSVVRFDIGNSRVKKGLDRIVKLFDTGLHRFDGYMSIHIFPFGFISSTYGLSYSIQNFFPLSDNTSSFSSKLYFSIMREGRNFGHIKSLVASTIDINRKVFEEDHDICKRIDFKSWLKLIDGPLSKDEVKIKKFRENLKGT